MRNKSALKSVKVQYLFFSLYSSTKDLAGHSDPGSVGMVRIK